LAHQVPRLILCKVLVLEELADVHDKDKVGRLAREFGLEGIGEQRNELVRGKRPRKPDARQQQLCVFTRVASQPREQVWRDSVAAVDHNRAGIQTRIAAAIDGGGPFPHGFDEECVGRGK